MPKSRSGVESPQSDMKASEESIFNQALDVTDAAAILAFAGEVGAVDVLFNCAGFVHHGTILDCTEEEWSFAFDLNVGAMYRLTRALLPGMLSRGGGSIINMSSWESMSLMRTVMASACWPRSSRRARMRSM